IGAGNTLPGDLIGRLTLNGVSIEHDVAFVDLVEPGDAVEKRCFTCAIGADDADDAALGDGKAQLVDGDETAEAFGDVCCFQNICHCDTSTSAVERVRAEYLHAQRFPPRHEVRAGARPTATALRAGRAS